MSPNINSGWKVLNHLVSIRLWWFDNCNIHIYKESREHSLTKNMVVSIRSDPDNPVTKSVLYHEFSGDGPALLTNHLQDPACVSLLPGTGRRGRYRWHLQWTPMSWWRHQIETFSALLAICDRYSQRPMTRSFDVFFDLRLNKRLSKQWWGWWFEMPSGSLWRHCNGGNPHADSI